MMSKAELKKPFCVQSGLEQEEETVLTSHVTNDIHSNRLSQKGTFFLYHESVKIAIKIIFLWKKSLEFLLLSKSYISYIKSYLMLINNHRKNIHKWEFFNQSRGVIFFWGWGPRTAWLLSFLLLFFGLQLWQVVPSFILGVWLSHHYSQWVVDMIPGASVQGPCWVFWIRVGYQKV